MFLFISLPWLSNELLPRIMMKQGLWCTIWLSYIYIYRVGKYCKHSVFMIIFRYPDKIAESQSLVY